jgi:uncharacterized membrane protein
MTLFQAALTTATILCSLVAGFLFAFAVVVMPGIGSLDDRGFIRAFQAIDRIIQDSQPLFVGVWLGSVLALVAAALLGVWSLDGAERQLLIAAALVYVLGVQLPTVTINLPLNSQLQQLDLLTLTEATGLRARGDFEPRWNRWNVIRTACAILVSVLLVLLVLRV